jgi:hypothetical protein
MATQFGSSCVPLLTAIAAAVCVTTACSESPTAPSKTASASAPSLTAPSQPGSVVKAATTSRVCTVADQSQIRRTFATGRLTVTNDADCTLYAGFGSYSVPDMNDPGVLSEVWLAQTSMEIAPHASGVLTIGWTEHCGDWVQEDFWILPRLVTSNPPRDEKGLVRSGPDTLLPGRYEPREVDGKRFLTTASDCVRPPAPPVPPTTPTPPPPPGCEGSACVCAALAPYVFPAATILTDNSQTGVIPFSAPAGIALTVHVTTGADHSTSGGTEIVAVNFYEGATLLGTLGYTNDVPDTGSATDTITTDLPVTFHHTITGVQLADAGPSGNSVRLIAISATCDAAQRVGQ